MRLKDLFTVPTGQKVTEKHLRRVLISSICSILLCMTCLVGATWAWFTVSIENTDNVIQIATVTQLVEIKKGDTVVSPVGTASYSLSKGTYTIGVHIENDATGSDDLNRLQGKVYVVMIVTLNNMSESYFFTFDGKQAESKELSGFKIGSGTAIVNFSVSWVEPASATPVGSETVVIGEIPTEPSTEPSTEATATSFTEPSTEATSPSTELSTEATTAPITEQQTTPTESSSAESTTATNPSEEMTGTDSTESTEVSTAVTEDA